MSVELGWIEIVALIGGACLLGYFAWMGLRVRARLRRSVTQHYALQRTSQDALVERDRLMSQLEELTVSCQQFTRAVQNSAAYEVIARQFAALVRAESEGPWVSLWLYDPANARFTLKAALPDAKEWLATDRVSLQAMPIATVVNERRFATLPELPPAIAYLMHPHVPTSRGVMLIPLSLEERPLALLLTLGSPAHVEAFQRNLLAIKLFATQASLAVWSVLQQELTILDHLTHANTYAYFKERFAQELHRCRRFDLPLSLLLVDIDDFKGINDTYGHQEGDRLLIMTARAIQKSIRSIDLLARYGGDEFIVMLPEVGRGKDPNSCEALPVAQRIRQTVAHQTVELAEQAVSVTVSIGIGIRDMQAPQGADPTTLFKQADEQLYRAKRAGKNRCAIPGGPLVGPD